MRHGTGSNNTLGLVSFACLIREFVDMSIDRWSYVIPRFNKEVLKSCKGGPNILLVSRPVQHVSNNLDRPRFGLKRRR